MDQSTHERGIALVLSMFLMTALSVLAAALMFLSQTETYASMNYRMMSQARYAGEAAVQRATNFLLDSTQYSPPGSVTDPLGNYNRAVSPVTYNGQPVVLSATSTVASNYPVAGVVTAFNNAAKGTLTAGNTDISFNAYATLVTMQTFESYGGGQAVVQTWEVTGVGALAGARNATVEVLATIETPKALANSYAAFATDNGCAALDFGGNVETKSYSTAGLTGLNPPMLLDSGGDVGTNGNLEISGHVDVNGNLYSPRSGVGACTIGNVTALTESGQATVSGSTVKLPTAVVYPTPTIPSPSSLAEVTNSDLPGTSATTCALFGLTAGTSAEVAAGTKQCNVTGTTITLNGNGSTLSLPGISPSAHVDFVLVASGPTAAQYNFNSIKLAGGASIAISATSLSQSVVVNVVGKNPDDSAIATPIDFQGGSTYSGVTGCESCSIYDAAMLQFIYGGTGQVKFAGNSNGSAVLYAPNSAVTLVGTSAIYGSVLGKTIDDSGGASIYYDSSLQDKFYVAGSPLIGTFTWKRY